ncbi:LLM class flavin-dependent oxidoreductase [Rhizobium sp. BK376]|uniref:LLM class flavin-dependent oxidoreductase n=1 Tax=Rhizobium sp. BK376 TaxID=2512149 RepID=UPI0010E136CB|nr:LLM class flavin-dependent oxidoreductase [Rhizobium sp. BK376]TCR70718.1 luciferase-like monooxygenase [Rhizobium sp. BK376]
MTKSKLHWGYALSPFGFSESAWRDGQTSDLGFDALLRQVDKARHAGFDFVALFDRLGKRPAETIVSGNTTFEPTTLLSALSSRARGIGFLAAASTAQHEAYNLARRFASLDTINGGRSGWIVLDDSTNGERDLEYVDVVKGLWGSWDADAFIYDKENGRFFDPAKMHVLNHKGPHLSVRGPLNVNRSPQDTPVVAALFHYGYPALAARHADVVILRSTSVDAARREAETVWRSVAEAGRNRAGVRLILSIVPSMATAKAPPGGSDATAPGGLDGLPLGDLGGDIAAALGGLASEADLDGYLLVPPSLQAVEGFISTTAPKLTGLGLGTRSASLGTLRSTLGLELTATISKQAGETK